MALFALAPGLGWAVSPNVTVDQLTTNDTTPTLTGAWQSGSGLGEGILTITVRVDGGVARVAALLGGTSGTWSVTVPTPLADGVHQVEATATLINLSTIVDGSTDELTIDSRPVTITVTELVTTDTTPLIQGTLDDPGGVVDAVEMEVDGATYVDYAPGVSTWSIAVPAALDPGTYDVLALALDNGGTAIATDSSSGELTIDDQPVAVTVTPLITANASPTLAGTYSATAGVADSIRVTVDGSSYLDADPAGGSWSATVTATLADGTYDVVAEVLDASGTVLASDGTADELRTGADVGLELVAPVGAVTFYQGEPASDSTPVQLATDVAVSTTAATNFDGGVLRLTMDAGPDAGDVLAVTGGDGVAIDTAGEISVDGVVFGTLRAGGSGRDGEDLVIDLVADGGTDAGANPATVERVVARLTFANLDPAHDDAVRIAAITLEDGDGGSGSATRSVQVEAVDNLPAIEPVVDILVPQDRPVAFPLVAVDADSATLTYDVDPGAEPILGSLAFAGLPSLTTGDSPVAVTYLPGVGASGSDAFRLRVSDDSGSAVSSSDDVLPGVATAVSITPFDDPPGDPDAVRPKVISDPPLRVAAGTELAHAIRIDPASVAEPTAIEFELEGAPDGVALAIDLTASAGPTATITWDVPDAAAGCYAFGLRVINATNRTVTWLPIMLLVEDLPGGDS